MKQSDPQRRSPSHGPPEHHGQTESHMVLGGFTLVLLVGGALLWLLFGPVVALVGVGVVVAAAAMLMLLLWLLRLLDAWTRGG